MYRRYLFICEGMAAPLVAWAQNKAGMRALARDELGWPHDMPMPRHCCMVIA